MLKIIDSKPGMNIAAANIHDDGDFHVVEFTSSPKGCLARLWFYFGLINEGSGSHKPKTRLIMKNANTVLGGAAPFQPVIKYRGRPWQRLSAGEKFIREDGYVNLHWEIDTPTDEAEIAFCFPYGEEEYKQLLADTRGFWHEDEIGVSGEGRPYFRLSNNYGSTTDRPRGVYLTARQHAMETSGAWVFDGLLRRLAEVKCPLTVWAIPFVNLDGVMAGYYGKDSYPVDINRAWGPNAPMRPESQMISHDMKRHWQERVSPDSMVLDFHSPGSGGKNVFLFARRELPPEWPVHEHFRQLEKLLGGYADPKFVKHADYKATAAWGDGWNQGEFVVNSLKMPHASVETSYYEADQRTLEIADYQDIGRIFADWLDSTL